MTPPPQAVRRDETFNQQTASVNRVAQPGRPPAASRQESGFTEKMSADVVIPVQAVPTLAKRTPIPGGDKKLQSPAFRKRIMYRIILGLVLAILFAGIHDIYLRYGLDGREIKSSSDQFVLISIS